MVGEICMFLGQLLEAQMTSSAILECQCGVYNLYAMANYWAVFNFKEDMTCL